MRKLKLQTQVSIDGYIAGLNGEMDWLVWDWDDSLKAYVQVLTEPVDCIILGRVLAQGFISAWAAQATNPDAEDFVHKMNDTHKIVFSRTLDHIEGKNTVLAKGDLVTEIEHLKQQGGADIIAYGGANFVSNLIKHGLIDELHLFVNPVALGKGMKIFTDYTKLRLVDSQIFACGIHVLHYQPLKP